MLNDHITGPAPRQEQKKEKQKLTHFAQNLKLPSIHSRFTSRTGDHPVAWNRPTNPRSGITAVNSCSTRNAVMWDAGRSLKRCA